MAASDNHGVHSINELWRNQDYADFSVNTFVNKHLETSYCSAWGGFERVKYDILIFNHYNVEYVGEGFGVKWSGAYSTVDANCTVLE